MDELLIENRKFISSKRASEITGYAQDYVGQLSRMGKISARRVGRAWYVDEEDIRTHRTNERAISGLIEANTDNAVSDFNQELNDRVPVDLKIKVEEGNSEEPVKETVLDIVDHSSNGTKRLENNVISDISDSMGGEEGGRKEFEEAGDNVFFELPVLNKTENKTHKAEEDELNNIGLDTEVFNSEEKEPAMVAKIVMIGIIFAVSFVLNMLLVRIDRGTASEMTSSFSISPADILKEIISITR